MASGVELPPRRRSWGDHGGPAHPAGWAGEALEDHDKVAGAGDARTDPSARGRGTPSRGTSRRALTIAHSTGNGAPPADWRQKMAAAIPLGRLGTPADVALAALFLVSDSAAWLTGVTLDVAGGYVMT